MQRRNLPRKSSKREIPPPSKLEREKSSPPEVSPKVALGFFAAFAAVAVFVFLASYLSRPPHLGIMSDWQLKAHERKFRNALTEGPGVLAGRNTGDGIEVLLLPLDGDAPVLFDVSSDMDFSAPHNPYEPAFTYWRKDVGRGLVIDWWQEFVEVFNILLGREAAYVSSKQEVAMRFIVNLQDFGILRGRDFGLDDDPDVPAYRFHAMPDPLGKDLYVVRNFNMVIDDMRFGVIREFAAPGSNAAAEMHEVSRSELGFENSDEYYDLFADPLPAEDGVYFSRYLFKRNPGRNADETMESSIVRLKTSGAGDFENVFTIAPFPGKTAKEEVENFQHLYFADKENRLFGFKFVQIEGGWSVVLTAYDAGEIEFTPICGFKRPFRKILVDYDERIAFFCSYDEPKPLDAPLEETGAAGQGGRGGGGQRLQPIQYWLCSIDLRSLEVNVLTDFEAGEVGEIGGRSLYGTAIITLSEDERKVIVSNGAQIFTIDYDGSGYKKLPTGGKTGWQMLYGVRQIESEK